MTREIIFHVSLLTTLLTALIIPARAEEILSDLPTSQQQAAEKTRSISGVEIGALRLLPKLTISGVYDDNIFATRTNTKSDRILHLMPSLDLSSHWSKRKIGL